MGTLLDLENGQAGIIVKVKGRGAFRRRITEMGFVRGKEVTVVKSAPLMDPIEYRIMGYNVSLRKSEGRLIEVITPEEYLMRPVLEGQPLFIDGAQPENLQYLPIKEKNKVIDVALVGNPNCGKTTLFNYASGSKEHVGNFSGVTVEAKTARFHQNGYTFNLTDLPGTYSLTAFTPEEVFVNNHILKSMPDVIVNVVVASNLERNLYLTTQLIDMDLKVVMALNMYDEMQALGDLLDQDALANLLGIPIIPTIGSKGTGLSELFNKIIDAYEDRDPVERHVHINYGTETELSLKRVQDQLWKDKSFTDQFSSRYFALKLLEKDTGTLQDLSPSTVTPEIISIAEAEISRLEKLYQEESSTLITDAKYGFIAG
ncbi:MAG: FeoB small GTPase domain-containing protein, partial [Bacteroidota bacterium]